MTNEPDDTVTARRLRFLRRLSKPTGKGLTRLLIGLGCLFLTVGTITWWLNEKVVSDDGFANTVASSLHDRAVRDYAADEISLRLSRTVPAVAAARPVVSAGLAEAMRSPLVEQAVRSALLRTHRQVFSISESPLVTLNAAQASDNVRAAITAVNPALAKKLPANFWTVSSALSQSRMVDALVRASPAIGPMSGSFFACAMALLVVAVWKARDTVHAVRAAGFSLIIVGAFLLGTAVASPLVGFVVDQNGARRAAAVSAVLSRLTHPLVNGGWWLVLFGGMIAFTAGRDGTIRRRMQRLRRWFIERSRQPKWQLGFASVGILVAVSTLVNPLSMLLQLLRFGAYVGLYFAIVAALGALKLLPADRATVVKVRRRGLVAVAAGAMMSLALTTFAAVGVVAAVVNFEPSPNAVRGCNGYLELCYARLNEVMMAASHNSMSTSANNFLSAEHTIPIKEQLNSGDRALLVDLYYGFDDNGIVRTNLAGGVDRKKVLEEQGQDALDALDRMGTLTGAVDASGTKKDLYLCHGFCELGASSAATQFEDIATFLDRNRSDVVVVIIEDYVDPADIARLMKDTELEGRLWIPEKGATTYPRLLDMVTPQKGEKENPRRLVVMSESGRGSDQYPWLLPAFKLTEETPFTFKTVGDFSCAPNRGADGTKDFFLLNHWLRQSGPPDPTESKSVNSEATLTSRIRQCIDTRKRLPGMVATDFTELGDLQATVAKYNAAQSALSGWTKAADAAVEEARQRALADPKATSIATANLNDVRRLPDITDDEARILLGADLATKIAARQANG